MKIGVTAKHKICDAPYIALAFVLLFPASSCAQYYDLSANGGYYQYSAGFTSTSRSSFSNGFSTEYSATKPVSRCVAPANGSSSTMAALEQGLNAIDTPTGWSRTPVSVQGRSANLSAGTYPQFSNQYAVPSRDAVPSPGQQSSIERKVGRLRSGPMAKACNTLFPGVPRQELMRVFIEGGMPDTGGSGWSGSQVSPPAANGANAANTSTAYSNYQTAVNEETKARNNEYRARSDSSQWNRKNAASRAEYAANNAEYAAERAESAANNGDSQARGYARLARQAANRAREDANRARYNADTTR